MSTVVRLPDAATLATDVAGRLIDRLAAVQRDGRIPSVALTGGTIATEAYRTLAASPQRANVDWASVDFWWGDERFVERDSDDRNALQARVAFLDAVGAAEKHIHEMPSQEFGSLEDAATAYGDELRAKGGGAFDVVLLGLGPDGHVASLFPGYPQLSVDDRIAVGVEDAPKPPPRRISLTYGALNHTRAVWFVAAGSSKAAAVAASIRGGVLSELPATGVLGTDETLWLIDGEAAQQLP